MTNRHLIYALLASVSLFVTPQSKAETIADSVAEALSAHPSIEAAQAGKSIAEEDRKEARSGLFPEISANASAGRVYSDSSTSRGLTFSRGAAYSGMGEGSAYLTQPLFDGNETFNRMDAAKARTVSADYNVTDVKENLAYQAIQAHLAIMQAQATLDKTQSYYDVIKSYLDRIQLMVDEGAADQSEMSQAQNISLMLKSALTDHQGQLDAAYAQYQQIIGHRPRGVLEKPSLSFDQISQTVDDAIANAQMNHPLMKAGSEELKAAGYDIKAEKAAYYPDLDGEVSYLQRDQREEIGGEVKDGRALLKMSWDFELGGGQQARTRRSKAQYSETLAQNQAQWRTIEGDIRRAYAEYDTAQKQMGLVKQREGVTKELFDAYETQFEGARVRLLQLMQSENQLFNAQLESITAEYRYLMSQFGVLASTGQLLAAMEDPVVMAGAELESEPEIEPETESVIEESNEEFIDAVEEIEESQAETPPEEKLKTPSKEMTERILVNSSK